MKYKKQISTSQLSSLLTMFLSFLLTFLFLSHFFYFGHRLISKGKKNTKSQLYLILFILSMIYWSFSILVSSHFYFILGLSLINKIFI